MGNADGDWFKCEDEQVKMIKVNTDGPNENTALEKPPRHWNSKREQKSAVNNTRKTKKRNELKSYRYIWSSWLCVDSW